MFRSLRLRLALSHAGVLAVILIVLGFSGQYLIQHRLSSAATAELLGAARSEADVVNEVSGAMPKPNVDADVPSRAAILFAVFKPDGTRFNESVQTPSWVRPYPNEVTNITVSGEPVRVVTVPVTSGTKTLATVVTARSLQPESSLIRQVRETLILGGILAVLASLVAGWFLAGLALRPVKRAYEAQAAFASDASHEFRTPLTFIRSGVEVMAESEPDLGGQVLDEIDYMTSLTQRLLMLARAENGTLDLDRDEIDLAAVCRSAIRRSEQAHSMTIRDEVPKERIGASGDRFATEAALDAVLENVKVHAGGEATITLEMDPERATVSVADHGPGIPSEAMGAAFDRFFRADPSRTRDTGGAGLGLHLAKTLVDAEGGEMWLEETPGGGLTAKIALPPA
jgi:signal transduction histidine kinase